MSSSLPDHLDLIAASPCGIQKLRGLILELAVRGKLVPQDPNDEPASQLLKRIAKEKARLVAEGKIRKGQPLVPVGEDEFPFMLPPGWEWIRLGQIGDWGAGATPLRSNSSYYGGSVPWFKSGELTADFISESEEHITEQALKECSIRRNEPGDVLIAMYGATIGKTAILSVAATTNQAVCACTPNTGIGNRYLLLLLRALKPNFVDQGAGGAQPNISREKIIATVSALPPEAEQHRIVAKVDELMALCDRLEAEQTDATSAHAKLVETLLGTLTQSRDAGGLAANWQRLSQHFDTLFCTETSLDALKQTILQLAVMGKLVPQDAQDEPASELLKRIAAEKARLAAEGRIRRAKPLAAVSEEEKPFELPGKWRWARFSEFAKEISTGPFGSMLHQSEYVVGGVPLINPSHMRNGIIVSDNSVTVSEDKAVELSVFRVEEGDIVMARRGEVGRTARVTKHETGWLCGTGSFILRFTSEISREFVVTLFRASSTRRFLGDEAVGTTMVNLNHGILNSMPVAVPPLAEQHRIVAKVDELMTLCDRLKADLAESRTRLARLSATLIESALQAA